MEKSFYPNHTTIMRLTAGYDVNGNSKRLLMIICPNSNEVICVVEEKGEGIAALNYWGKTVEDELRANIIHNLEVKISKSEYKKIVQSSRKPEEVNWIKI